MANMFIENPRITLYRKQLAELLRRTSCRWISFAVGTAPIEPKVGEVLFLFEQMAGFHPHEPHWYIPLFGVDPVFQGQGYGTQLMRQGLVVCDRDQQPAYLEATSPANRAFYERHGFRVLGEIRSGDSPPLFPMLREPR